MFLEGFIGRGGKEMTGRQTEDTYMRDDRADQGKAGKTEVNKPLKPKPCNPNTWAFSGSPERQPRSACHP